MESSGEPNLMSKIIIINVLFMNHFCEKRTSTLEHFFCKGDLSLPIKVDFFFSRAPDGLTKRLKRNNEIVAEIEADQLGFQLIIICLSH